MGASSLRELGVGEQSHRHRIQRAKPKVYRFHSSDDKATDVREQVLRGDMSRPYPGGNTWKRAG